MSDSRVAAPMPRRYAAVAVFPYMQAVIRGVKPVNQY